MYHPAFFGLGGPAGSSSPRTEELGIEFVFLPAAGEANEHHPRPKLYRNPNRPGTPLAFWREVKDVLRLLTFHRRRGTYVAPGPGNRRNNIERDPFPGHSHSPLPSVGEGIAQLFPRRPHLDVPPWPPFAQPSQVATLPIATLPHTQSPVFIKGQKLLPNQPISYSQAILFIGDTAQFVNQAAAARVMSSLLTVMQEHPNVQVEIVGNAATDFEDKLAHQPYGSNARVLRKSPLYGYDQDGKPYYGTYYRTMGDLMMARARAIGRLLTSRGISISRIHCRIGRLDHGSIGLPGSGALKRRATIIVTEKL